ncbi:Holliday junction resolvase RecU [Mycoplasmopsis cricetuli]|uniref:Holliday junction resolvase RecU n=1 Tax=Mycoplasmopsis cricetuli TaxID=171283 RepID=UPI0004714B40|nr:Holliday junction resolvase RecU [Mycoplasmopsis cricetuli]
MNKNKGMLLEKIINQTINFMWKNKIAFIEKKQLPYNFQNIIVEKNKLKLKNVTILGKSTVDYIGIYQGKFICFEAKTTDEDVFYLSNIKEHQYKYLNLINQAKGIAFLILFFSSKCLFFKIDFLTLEKIYSARKKIDLEWLKENSKELTLEFPGYLNLLD